MSCSGFFSLGSTCPSEAATDAGFDYHDVTEKYYKYFSTDKKNYFDAKAHCETFGATLAMFKTEEEFDFIRGSLTNCKSCTADFLFISIMK